MELKPKDLARAVEASDVKTTNLLCTENTDIAVNALKGDEEVIIACEQQSHFFNMLSEEVGVKNSEETKLITVDIRDRAGWTSEKSATAKQAALLSELTLEKPMTLVKDIISKGVCLILGHDEAALDLAEKLCETLAVTVILSKPLENLTPTAKYDVAVGKITSIEGSLSNFKISAEEFSTLNPSGRGAATFGPMVDGATSECDIVIDLSGRKPFFPADTKRDGYLREDSRNSVGLEQLVAKAANLLGEFEKTLYVKFEADLCAHSRASKKGCDRCLNVCPTGAINPAGDIVTINPDICAGCGSCAAVCPSGAILYDDPPIDYTLQRLQKLFETYVSHGGARPRLLFHDSEFGIELISLSARFGKGLPTDVIPFSTNNIENISHTEMLAVLAIGYYEIFLLKTPNTEGSTLDLQIAIVEEVLQASGNDIRRLKVIDTTDPEMLEKTIYKHSFGDPVTSTVRLLGQKREVTRTAATAIAKDKVSVIPLPLTAPYGEIVLDTNKCTLCLACVSLCPTGALQDNADRPEVNFTETSCIQCGICANTCPEKAIQLVPRLELSPNALSQRHLHSEEPFSCISCNRPFGVKSTVEKIVEKLEGKHWMYQNSDNTKLVQMCDDCRVNAQYHQENSPFKMGDRPKVRTTDDYK